VNAARKTLISLLALIGVGALALSASSTLQLASKAGVENVQVAAIAVLELSSIVGTIMWLRAASTRARIESAVLVVGASAVAAVGGLGAYGLFGLVGPAFLVASVHVASQEWRPATTVVTPQAEPEPRPEPEPEPGWGPPSAVTTPEPVTDPVPVTNPVRDLRPVTGKRTRRELVAAGAPLGVKRRANELLDDFQARVEQAERDRQGAA